MKTKKKIQAHSSHIIFILGISVILLLLSIVVLNLPSKGYQSKAAEVQANCKQLCDTKLPNHMKYTLDCAAKIQAGTTEPCGCEKACIKVVEAMNTKNMTCEVACKSQLRTARAEICQQLLCPELGGAAPPPPADNENEPQ